MGVYYPSGPYIGKVLEQNLGESKNKGTPQLVLKFQIINEVDRISGERLELERCEERWVYLYLTEKAMDMALKSLKALGYKRSSLKYLDPNVDGFQDLAGTEVELYCKHEEYEGDLNERWSISTPRETKPVDASSLRKLDALFGKGLKELVASGDPQATGKVNNLLEEAAAVEKSDSDAPF